MQSLKGLISTKMAEECLRSMSNCKRNSNEILGERTSISLKWIRQRWPEKKEILQWRWGVKP